MTRRSTTPQEIHSFAPAKLNLCLRIVGRREDGRHLLESLFWPLAWGDELTIHPGLPPSLEIDWTPDAPRVSALPTDGTNLVLRAVEASGVSAAVHLRKRVPAEAGLGGGSSDAGAVLRTLAPHLDRAVAANLGADVPFFLDPRPSWMVGVGDERSAWTGTANSWGFVVAIPPFALSTAAVFSHFKREGRLAKPGALPPGPPDELQQFLQTHGNALTESAVALAPDLREVLQALQSVAPLVSGMSGSGSACFAVFETLAIAKEKAQVLDDEFRFLNCKWIAAGTYVPRAASAGEHHGNHRGENFPGERR